MHTQTRISPGRRRVLPGWALAIPAAALGFAPGQGLAQAAMQEAADAVTTAQGIQQDPDCVTETVAGQVAAEGARRIGAAASKMFGKVGINTGRAATAAAAPATNPCRAAASSAAGAVPAVAPVAAPAPRVAPARARLGARNNDGSRNCGALGTGCADGMKPLVACYDEKKGWLWKVLADAIEEKRERTPGLTAEQRADINADIAALRAAHAAGANRVEPVDAARPDRYNSWLSGDEYSVAANHANQTIRDHEQGCQAKYSRF